MRKETNERRKDNGKERDFVQLYIVILILTSVKKFNCTLKYFTFLLIINPAQVF